MVRPDPHALLLSHLVADHLVVEEEAVASSGREGEGRVAPQPRHRLVQDVLHDAGEAGEDVLGVLHEDDEPEALLLLELLQQELMLSKRHHRLRLAQLLLGSSRALAPCDRLPDHAAEQTVGHEAAGKVFPPPHAPLFLLKKVWVGGEEQKAIEHSVGHRAESLFSEEGGDEEAHGLVRLLRLEGDEDAELDAEMLEEGGAVLILLPEDGEELFAQHCLLRQALPLPRQTTSLRLLRRPVQIVLADDLCCGADEEVDGAGDDEVTEGGLVVVHQLAEVVEVLQHPADLPREAELP
mmetsp:Transcript_5075/g.18243  ORF Transcript_5075/g.18243 Transcript_5075/m.18243 type:complete len:295 (+) Transcript_5075:1107-1991(+)